jgi:hypothetical protein
MDWREDVRNQTPGKVPAMVIEEEKMGDPTSKPPPRCAFLISFLSHYNLPTSRFYFSLDIFHAICVDKLRVHIWIRSPPMRG